ncbi:MAG: hypothetical protein ACOX6J_00160 [Oscillospiraceae bacterium]|jgi:hypothetical protein
MARDYKPKRYSYLDDYSQNAAGEYVYTGTYYTWPEGRTRILRNLWIWTAVETAASVICGFMPKAGMEKAFYVLLPYTLSLMFVGFQVWAAANLTGGGTGRITRHTYETTVKRLPVWEILSFAGSAAAAVAEVCYMVFGEFEGEIPFGIVLTVLQVLVAFSAWMARKTVTASKFTEEKR